MSQTETQHARTPWQVETSSHGGSNVRDADGNVPAIARVYDSHGQAKANAALIVRAVNSHAALVAACEKLAERFQDLMDNGRIELGVDECESAEDELLAARAAIAKARR